MPTVSVIIPSLNREESLRVTLESLWSQTNQAFEIIVERREGELAFLRNKAARKAKGKIIVFIDDDVWCPAGWIDGIIRGFKDKTYAGVSGPAVVLARYRRQRDIFKFKAVKKIYDSFFCDGRSSLPGHISKAGAWTTGATENRCRYEGEVEFLEACNMAFRKDIFDELGGFDEGYKGIGDWSEPDLSFRIRRAGHKLWFTGDARLYHRPSQTGAYKKRLVRCNRMENYERFSRAWIEPHWKHTLYKRFLKSYFWLKEHRCV